MLHCPCLIPQALTYTYKDTPALTHCHVQAELQAALQAELDRLGVQDAAAWLVLHAAEQPGKQQHHEAAQQPMFPHPRHARVNILKASVADVLQRLQTAADAADGGSGGRALTSALPRPVVDKLLPDVLEFLPGTDLHAHPLVREGVLLLQVWQQEWYSPPPTNPASQPLHASALLCKCCQLSQAWPAVLPSCCTQSKASCMPAHALQPQAGWHIVDCCAAPGNKTTHVAALLHAACAAAQNAAAPVAPRVFAFDRDAARLERLRANVKRTGAADIVTACCADFLSIDPEAPEYAQVPAAG
jgi:25S rRNA (cytosine2278-C5)-methyltransferase